MGFWMSISESGVNPQANTSVVTVNLYYSGNGLSWSHMSPSGAIVIDGTSYGFRHNFERSRGTQWLASASKTVGHNADGSRWVGCSAWFATGVSLGTLSTSGGKTLTKIARAVPPPAASYTDVPTSLGWTINGPTNPDGVGLTGTAAICNKSYITAKNYGTGSGWHGVSITKDIPADSKGATGATDFTLTYKQVFASVNANDRGKFFALVQDTSGNALAGVELSKPWAGSAGKVTLLSEGVSFKTFDFNAAPEDSHFGTVNSAAKTTTIIKSGRTMTFNTGGFQAEISSDTLAGKTAGKIVFFFLAYGTYAGMSFNGLYSCKLVKNYTTLNDIPNTFSAGDVLLIDTATGEITLNGLKRPDLGAIGNDWEELLLIPGINIIGVSHSDFGNPKILMKYREVYV